LKRLASQTLRDVLTRLGVEAGDHLLVHSNLTVLGWPVDGIGMYLDVLRELVGDDGTIAVPTFSFSFCREGRFDLFATPSEAMGSFSEYVRTQPGARRTRHPMQSLALLGHHAARLAGISTSSAFGCGSVMARLPKLGFKLLLLGASARSVSMVHYSEESARVPYRFWKSFVGRVDMGQGERTTSYEMYVRDLDAAPDVNEERVRQRLTARGQWRDEPLNYGRVATCRIADYTRCADEMLRADPYALIENREQVIATLERKQRVAVGGGNG